MSVVMKVCLLCCLSAATSAVALWHAHRQPDCLWFLLQASRKAQCCLVSRHFVCCSNCPHNHLSTGSSPLDDHWSVRRQAAALLSAITAAFSAPHHNLRPRLCRVLAQTFLDASKPLTSKYGAIVGLQVSTRQPSFPCCNQSANTACYRNQTIHRLPL